MRCRQTLAYLLVTFVALLFAAALAPAQESARVKDFGKQWVRSHPFTIMGVTMIESTFDLAKYKAANMSAFLAWKVRPGLLGPTTEAKFPHFVHLYAKEGVNDAFVTRVRELQGKYPYSLGFIINDEPVLTGFPATGEVIAWLKQNYPDRLAMSNAWPIGGTMKEYSGGTTEDYSYSQYVDDYMRIIQPDVLMFDIYIYSDAPDGDSGVSDVYFQNLAVIRDHALKAGVPYWTFIQSYKTDNRRLPSESDLRMQVFSSLAFGFTGIAYFTYEGAFERGLLEPNGEPSPLYAPAAKLNAEMLNLGKSLRYLTSTGVKFVPGTKNTRIPVPLEAWSPAKDERRLREVSIVDGTDGQSGLLASFRDDANKQYFMLVNLHQAAGRSAEQCRATFNLKFGPTIRSIQRLNRQTGQAEHVPIDDPTNGLTIELDGGTGDLFKFHDGPFAGLD